MNLKGTHKVNASAKKIWDLLMDTDTLARITPAITKLEKIDAENFKAIADVKIGPINGAFTGNLKISDLVEPESFTLSVQQNSKIGNADVAMKMNLNSLSESETEVSFDGNVKLTGMLNTMGQRVITPIANMLTKQFFDALAIEVAK
jgi:uncharacterized protein